MLRFGLALLLVAATFGASSPAQEKATGKVTVTWWGQSFFIVTSAKGTRVAFDPHGLQEYGRITGLKADIICISHLHTDHNAVYVFENAKDKNVRILNGLSGMGLRTTFNTIDEKIGDVRIRSVPAYHDDKEGLIRGKNTIFCVEMDGWKICHLGDLGQEPTPTQLKKIGPVDVLMVPVGGIYTLNGPEAKKAVEMIQPKEYIFPMHYGTRVFNDVLPVDEFLEDQEKAKIAISDDNKVILNRDKQRPRPLIVQLNFAPKGK
jgi:L-ascorbate metabolism protein UlaG (beta-lactamase superfamily)